MKGALVRVVVEGKMAHHATWRQTISTARASNHFDECDEMGDIRSKLPSKLYLDGNDRQHAQRCEYSLTYFC